MVAFDFKPEFADLIRSGFKVQTVRRPRRCAPGDTMHLFTGLRSAACVRIAERRCALVAYCHLTPAGVVHENPDLHPDSDGFARLDGFASYDDMLAWFRRVHGTDRFIGHVHRWDPAP